jgi:hypothetical protein
MNKVLHWMMAVAVVSTLGAATAPDASADVCVKPGVIQKTEKVLKVSCPAPEAKTTVSKSIIHNKVPVTSDVLVNKKVKRTKWVAIERPVYKLVKKGRYAKKTVWVNRKVLAKKTTYVDRPTMVETRVIEKPVVIERRILVEKPIVVRNEPVATADVCAAPVVDACPPAAVIEKRRSHFLRFGLGPILDLGIL